MKEARFGGAFVAGQPGQDGSAGQAKEHDHPHLGEANVFGAISDSGKFLSVGFGVLQRDHGAIDGQNPAALQKSGFCGAALSGLGAGIQRMDQDWRGQTLAGFAIDAIVAGNALATQQRTESLDLANHLPARGPRVQRLPEKTPEGQRLGVTTIPAVGLLFGLGKKGVRQAG